MISQVTFASYLQQPSVLFGKKNSNKVKVAVILDEPAEEITKKQLKDVFTRWNTKTEVGSGNKVITAWVPKWHVKGIENKAKKVFGTQKLKVANVDGRSRPSTLQKKKAIALQLNQDNQFYLPEIHAMRESPATGMEVHDPTRSIAVVEMPNWHVKSFVSAAKKRFGNMLQKIGAVPVGTTPKQLGKRYYQDGDIFFISSVEKKMLKEKRA